MDLKEKNKAIYPAALFTFFFFFIFAFIFPLQSNDDSEWRNMANPEHNTYYQSSLRIVLPFIVWDNLLWTSFWIILFAFVFPVTLAWWSDSWLAIPFYFCCTNFFYLIINSGLYAQGIATLLLIIFLASKKTITKILYLLIAITIHQQSIYLFGTVIGLILIIRLGKKFAPMCSPIFYKSNIFTEKLNGTVGDWGLTIRDIGSFFTKGTPLPFVYKAFTYWFKKKEWFYFLFFLCLWPIAWFVQDRVLYTFFPLMIVGFTKGFQESKHQKFWIALVLLWGLFQFEQFIFLRMFC